MMMDDNDEKSLQLQSEKYWENNDGFFFTIIYALICTFGAIANLTVLIVFARSSSLRNVRNRYGMSTVDHRYGRKGEIISSPSKGRLFAVCTL